MSHLILPMSTRRTQHGAGMIEVLVAVLVIAFGILGFVGLQGQTAVSQLEGYQRTQALLLLNDMAQRMALNRDEAGAYLADDIGAAAAPEDCSAQPSRAATDLCEWSRLIQGAAEVQGNARLGAMIGARACITRPAPNVYQISLVWQGLQATGAPATLCGRDAYASEDTRRAVSTVVQMADLAS
jgi:type IV pilus assembly protein PilV